VAVVFLFPGQGSQEPGTLHHLIADQGTEAVVREMSGVLGFDALSLDTAKALKSTIGVQLSLLAAGVATARVCSTSVFVPLWSPACPLVLLLLPLLRMRSRFQIHQRCRARSLEKMSHGF
jgi:hypothetical protein